MSPVLFFKFTLVGTGVLDVCNVATCQITNLTFLKELKYLYYKTTRDLRPSRVRHDRGHLYYDHLTQPSL